MLRLLLLPALLVSSSLGAELQKETIQAWDQFLLQRTAQPHSSQNTPVILHQPGPSKLAVPNRLRSRLQAGEIISDPAVSKGMIIVPDGVIHDWTGLAFFPNASIEDVVKVTGRYDRYKEIYAPYIVDGLLTRAQPSRSQFALVFRQHVMSIEATVYGEFESRYSQLDPQNALESTTSTRLQETVNLGRSDETRLPEDTGRGYIWRLRSIRTYQQADGGVYVQLEVIVLSRSIPPSLRWLVNPIVARISKAAVVTTLRQTRNAVEEPNTNIEARSNSTPSLPARTLPSMRSSLVGSSVEGH